ncbi:MAG TPA: PQQ-dependent sugar dehydrogenase [Chloroflexota bacterium]|nr:PQQ-dependent sugar dehydrogenase [Chloroflexota bacterium]
MLSAGRQRSLALLSLTTALALACQALAPPGDAPQAPAPASGPAQAGLTVETLATGLEVPWALAWAPDGRLFLTERPGRVRLLVGGELRPEPVAVLPASRRTAEGGLLGLALAPDFAAREALYVYYTYDTAGGVRNRVSRLELAGDHAGAETVLLDDIPGARIHDGGVLAFGPDGKLYIGTGDATQRALAQDPTSLAGKILRLNPDGTVPDDNPFPGSPVYSLGHRNVQGLAWQPGTGQLYAAEHGPSGENGWCCHDEVNRILPGANYGWPLVIGQAGDPRFVDPVIESGTATWPPGGLAFATEGSWAGDLFLATLAGGQLWRFTLSADGSTVVDRALLIAGEYGRLRALARGPDGALYVATSNRDGRGRPNPGDDRLLRLTPP